MRIVGNEYIYTSPSGHAITVFIIEDGGMVQGSDRLWHKVTARPIGYNNAPLMVFDFETLKPRY